jgi:hypothetical protein
VNLAELVVVPPGVVTAMAPVTAPFGTKASTCVSLMTWKLVAATPPKVTPVVPVKEFPVIETEVPLGPLVGVKLVMAGATTKFEGLLATPPAVVIVIFWPVLAPAGTVAVTCVSDLMVNPAVLPPMVTFEVWVRLTPLIVINVPTLPLLGVKLVICGVTRKDLAFE